MTYYSIWQSINETCPHTTLHSMRGIPEKDIYIIYYRRILRKKIFNLQYIQMKKTLREEE